MFEFDLSIRGAILLLGTSFRATFVPALFLLLDSILFLNTSYFLTSLKGRGFLDMVSRSFRPLLRTNLSFSCYLIALLWITIFCRMASSSVKSVLMTTCIKRWILAGFSKIGLYEVDSLLLNTLFFPTLLGSRVGGEVEWWRGSGFWNFCPNWRKETSHQVDTPAPFP